MFSASLLLIVLSPAFSATLREPAAAAVIRAALPEIKPEIPFETRSRDWLLNLREAFLKPESKALPELDFPVSDTIRHASEIARLKTLREEAAFLRAGRLPGLDDGPTFADMAVVMALRLQIDPPETAIPLYQKRSRTAVLSPGEENVHKDLAESIQKSDFAKRYLYIGDLLGSHAPAAAKIKSRHRKKRPETAAPAPKETSVISQIDWGKAESLANIAEETARNFERRPGEGAKKYLRRIRSLKKHCYAWVRQDLAKLGFWDSRLFHDCVPPTRRDPKRPIRAASFALAMAKVSESESKNGALAERTPLRELNLRVDPLVRGSIVVFSQGACGYDRRNGHIEIVTSLEPLKAASYKFHPLSQDCLISAAKANRAHVYVPLGTISQTRP